MTDPEPPSLRGPNAPHDANGNGGPKRTTLWSRLKGLLALRTASLRDDLKVALEDEASAELSEFSPNERKILQNVLKLGTLTVDDVAVPRADIEAVEAEDTVGQLIAEFRRVGHSRLPVYREELDSIIGFVHIKDVLSAIAAPAEPTEDGTRQMPIRLVTPILRQKITHLNLIRDVLYVPPSMFVSDLLRQMQSNRVHMAIVIDEFGGTDGLVTIEDLLEAVVGDIDDEYDVDGPALIKKVDEDTYVMDARAELEEIEALIGPDFRPGEAGEDVDTIGGLVLDLADRVPVRGEIIAGVPGFTLEVLAADARRVKKVRVKRVSPGEPPVTLTALQDRPALDKPAEAERPGVE